MPLKKLARKPRSRMMRKKTTTTRPARLSKPMALAVKRLVSGSAETKYVAAQLQKAIPVDTFISINPTTDLVSAIPPCVEGVGSFQRVGQRISNIVGRTHFHFSLPYNYGASSNWIVRVYMLTSVLVKGFDGVPALSANTLLDKGDGTTSDWDPTTDQVIELSQRPLSNENFRGHFKEFRLSKNSGALNGDSSTPPPSPNGGHYSTYHNFIWNWKHTGAVKYRESLDGTPENFNPMFTLVAYPPDNFAITKDPSPVLATIRTEMHFKDI